MEHRKYEDSVVSRRTATSVATALLVCNAVSLGAIYFGVRRYPPFWSQAGAWVYVCEPVAMLLVYSGLVVWGSEKRGEWWDTVLQIAVLFGMGAAAVDFVGLIVENGMVVHVRGPAVQIATMLTLFALWGVAAWRAARLLGSIRAGLVTAVVSAGVCMMVAVMAALIMQLFFVHPSVAEVAAWSEFKRSGWTNPRAFAIANTLDSGFMHFVVAPVVACITGGIGAVLGSVLPHRTVA